MHNQNYYQELHTAIQKLVTNDYVFLDLPYYSNVGDMLIWEATLQILKKVKQRCLYSCSVETYRKPKIGKDVILLFSGGGNFGDLWPGHQELRHRILNDYPNNDILQLPQSVWFDNDENLRKDVEAFSMHRGKITICLRDQQSFDIVKDNYSDNVNPLLLPDMALSFNIKKYCRYHRIKLQSGDGTLLVKRKDKEDAAQFPTCHYDHKGDWPCMETAIRQEQWYNNIIHSLRKRDVSAKKQDKFTDWYYRNILMDAYIQTGIRFINPYRHVVTDRLHAGILAWLMGKDVTLVDNSYGKISSLYNTWLKNCDSITIYGQGVS